MAKGTEKETAGGERERDVALFKFSLIAPVVAGTFTQATKMDYYRETCEKEHQLPGGKKSEAVPAHAQEMVLAVYGQVAF